MLISWLYLMIAILFEVSGTTCMKLSEEFTKIVPSILIFVFYGLCLTFLTLSLRKLEVSIVYAVWSGFGTILITSIGIVWFRESFTLVKVMSIFLIIVGVIGLNLGEYLRNTNN
ncbi:multidrug efflux SMR transporter [Anabaena sphaerica FACHB-251]|uniref:Multidrug efflux SMR transporter n=1 Tax=Anabaena sphaerica FACHB-251 TaxID=2692883 RepID=A0A926WCL3_9NOST|nr:multidrug efflux SMR transporter [Anabaena sphaerica]MBD2291987.1 multidrug efflux SMR transporter [Anabaena sphaerica FACHB-251]